MTKHERAREAIKDADLIGRRNMRNGEYIIVADYIQKMERLELAAKRILNLSNHPLFPEVNDFPAWEQAKAELEIELS